MSFLYLFFYLFLVDYLDAHFRISFNMKIYRFFKPLLNTKCLFLTCGAFCSSSFHLHLQQTKITFDSQLLFISSYTGRFSHNIINFRKPKKNNQTSPLTLANSSPSHFPGRVRRLKQNSVAASEPHKLH